MARTTFEGPILSGDNRNGPLRSVGYADLIQNAQLNLTNSTAGTPGYAGGSGQFVTANTIPNVNATVYTSSATAYPPVAATITPDPITATGTLYRGVVMYLPYQSNLSDIIVDTAAAVTITGGTLGTVAITVGNTFNTSTYASITSPNTLGRNATAYTAAQLTANQSTSADITLGNRQGSDFPPVISQVVFTISIPYTLGSGTPVITAGTFYISLRYQQIDRSLGSTTAYPYGNLT